MVPFRHSYLSRYSVKNSDIIVKWSEVKTLRTESLQAPSPNLASNVILILNWDGIFTFLQTPLLLWTMFLHMSYCKIILQQLNELNIIIIAEINGVGGISRFEAIFGLIDLLMMRKAWLTPTAATDRDLDLDYSCWVQACLTIYYKKRKDENMECLYRYTTDGGEGAVPISQS